MPRKVQKETKSKQKSLKSKPQPKSKTRPQKSSAAKSKLKPVQKKGSAKKEADNARLERLRKLLIQKREDIVKEARDEIKKFKSGEKKQIVETVMDDGDLSVVDLSEDISLKQLSTHRETLIKIDTALRKLSEGTYGKCDECGDDISEERLKIMPFAIYCRDCQEKIELIEKIESEEEE